LLSITSHHVTSRTLDLLAWTLRYATLRAMQGSGLINALYMPPVSSAVAVYLNDGWPISSADPLAVLGDRGPYIVHINTDPSKIICNRERDQVLIDCTGRECN
jgi:hypothetical protein